MNRKITTKLFAFTAALAFLLVFSCRITNGDSGNVEQEEIKEKKAYITLSVSNVLARTALPVFTLTEFNTFTLYGKQGTNEEITLKSWQTDSVSGKSAYDLLNADRVDIKLGQWTLRLSAVSADGTVYQGSVEKEIVEGANEVSFTVDLTTIPQNGKGNISIVIKVNTPGELALVTASLFKNDGTAAAETTVLEEKSFVNEGTQAFEKTVAFADCDAGSYKVVLNYFADAEKKNLLGTCPEYAVVVPAKTSTSTVELESLDSTYSISYKSGESSELKTEKFTRHSKVVLPNVDSPVTAKDGYIFCGWYASVTDTQLDAAPEPTPILEIPENTVGNKTYYAKFINLSEVTAIKAVKIDGVKQVGNTLTAFPYTKEDSTDAQDKFTGAVESYKWYKGSDSNGDSVISDNEWTLIADATGKDYLITQNDLGKSFRAEITQKYTAQKDEEKKIYIIVKNNPAVSSVATDAITKGQLNESSVNEILDKILTGTGGGTGQTPAPVLTMTYNDTPVIGSDLSAEKVAVTEATADVKDSSNNDVSVKITPKLPAGSKAPETSNYVPAEFVVTASGYEDLTVSCTAEKSPLFVNVKYASPVTSGDGKEVPELEIENGENPQITTGNIEFDPTFTNSTESLEYTTTVSSEDAAKPDEDAVWIPLYVDQEFKHVHLDKTQSPSVETIKPFVGGEKIFIRKKAKDGTPDSKGNNVGAVAVSEPVTITVAEENVGKKTAIKIQGITFDPLSDIKVTLAEDKVTLTVENAESYDANSINWQPETDWLIITPDGEIIGKATVTIKEENGIPVSYISGTYGIEVTASKKGITYSTMVYITLGN